MHNALDMLNVCIAPTRLCNLRCEHCYIAPELLSDRSQMSEEVYRKTFDKIEELFKADRKVSKINVELLGGELTMMPLAFWERNLPWTLERMASWDALYDAEASLIWCTNLIFKDPGYVDLLNRMGEQYPAGIDLFVPWEPDTNRFKKDLRLLPRYLQTLKAITGIRRRTLCVTMSQAVIADGPEFLVDTFLPAGITDITCDMLYPAGSGKTYFSRACSYGDVSQFILDLHALLPNSVELSPMVEMEAACRTLTHYHYAGNDTYDIEVEPSGEVTFNSSFTGEESRFGTQTLHILDESFAAKTIFNNTPELALRHRMPYPECKACEFAVVCSGGWAWHKQLSPEQQRIVSHGDCAGLKRLWEHAKRSVGIHAADRSEYISKVARRAKVGSLNRRRLESSRANPVKESEFLGAYEEFFTSCEPNSLIEMVDGELHQKDWIERLFFYDAIGCQVSTDGEWYSRAARQGGEELFRHIVYRNYHFLSFDPGAVAGEVLANPDWELAKELKGVLHGGTNTTPARKDELFEFAATLSVQLQRETSDAFS